MPDDPQDQGPTTFDEALLALQREAGDVPAVRRSRFLAYLYASTADVVDEYRDLLLGHGFTVLFHFSGFDDIETETKDGKPQWVTTVSGHAEVRHVPSGEVRTYPVLGRTLNESDKGIYHATQQARKLFYLFLTARNTLAPDEDNPAAPAGGQSRAPRRQRQQQQAPPPPAAASQRIREANGIPFRGKAGEWVREDTGEQLQTCANCQSPMIQVESFYCCVKAACGNRLPVPKPNGARKRARPQNTETPKAKIQRCKDSLKAIYRKHRLEQYHIFAVIAQTPGWPQDQKAWKAETWVQFLEMAQATPQVFENSVREMAAEEPAEAAAVERLRQMVEEHEVKGPDRIRVESACHSGWARAVADVTADIELKYAGPEQGRMPV